MNVKVFLGILIASMLSGCATVSQENNSLNLMNQDSPNNQIVISKEKKDFLINYKSNKAKKAINPKSLFTDNKISIDDNYSRKKKKGLSKDYIAKSENLINLNVTYSGKYKITNNDIILMSMYHRRFIYKEYRDGDRRVYKLPTYNPLKMSRSGPNWKIEIIEKLNGKFKISGKNSEGKTLNTICDTIKDCFNMI